MPRRLICRFPQHSLPISHDNRRGESSDEIRARVEAARQRQRERFAGLDNGAITNADMRVAEVRQFCELDEAGQALIKAAMTQLQLSARAYHRILKLSRTIADLAGEENIQPVIWQRHCCNARRG